MNADERESQLSAMYDGELPGAECELLARRLSRDGAMKQQWARFALIGAVMRNEPLRARRDPAGRLAAGIAGRLVVAIEAEELPEQLASESLIGQSSIGQASRAGDGTALAAQPVAVGRWPSRWARPAAGFAIAAGVAALSVVWLQGRAPVAVPLSGANLASPLAAGQDSDATVVPVRGAPAPGVGVDGRGVDDPVVNNGEPESYVVPLPAGRASGGPPAQLANYVVAHSEFSAPLSRRSLLSALVASEAATVPVAAPVVAPPAPPPEGAGDDGGASNGGASK